MNSSFEIENSDSLRAVCGPNDMNIGYIEELTGCQIVLHGNRIDLNGSEDEMNRASQLLNRLIDLSSLTSDISTPDILLEYKAMAGNGQLVTVGTKTIRTKGQKQAEYVFAMQNSQIVFAVGPAGTGKTYLATNWCLGELLSGRKNKIVITRPVVEAGESLGFLPGDLSQKLNPYLKPLYDSMEATISPATVRRLEESGQIEIAPLAYMRGRSLNNSCVILDEAQNTTVGQMKMFLTRLGENSCAIITGDITQTDLPKNQTSGLVDALNRLDGVEGVSFVRFSGKDTVRSRIVQRIINAYEK
ncbi:MAG: PhoH family protein [Spirochaetales bacterium]